MRRELSGLLGLCLPFLLGGFGFFMEGLFAHVLLILTCYINRINGILFVHMFFWFRA